MIIFPNGKDKARLHFLVKEELQRQKVTIILRKDPSVVSEDNIEEYKHILNNDINTIIPKLLVTGQIP